VVKKPVILRVGIIGGGLGGLTLAQLLVDKPNIQVTVYERNQDSVDRLCGYRVMLSYFVLQNLQATLRRDVWSRVASSIGTHAEGGEELRFMKRHFIPTGDIYLSILTMN